ncbi:TetR/AcrR family transcriptional regulator [Streptomyces samsunensis]|uniref:TetR/AcrR family transcriptional regulator n=2 Tax=Streptomyces malaysiensis TaxID=92644 RepID=A0ABX6VWE2_STRMQ|nr:MULTISPECIES: TetR/AcrR family transcriptional regulator [Streptomyces]MCC4317309.1 TetR/AcrR family transcriptional regulator [Streptomyces malaysiensis]MCD9586708.1 TetR/AcrR family transcriptional regulator [Streptomyces sp. 8ZJF_21]MCM3806855.1 TetR/AcrR family transcriptional regulator [Streptomyces sp. DR7-3]MCQ6247801.1 TetR/AcrR family transcriptional regulator [Streptomyces malaysiensis]MCQ8833643.1 TetR/AcrR family transcriptional regulator [Streptomyces samsunensis]
MVRSESESRPSEARSRLLKTAIRVFYAEGIHAVGVDRIVAEAQVTRATFYRHFPSKESLVVAYLNEADRAIRGQADAAVAAGLPAADTIRTISASIAEGIRSPGFRGCAFLNAVAEYPDPDHPVHQAVLAHRQWFLDTITELLAKIREQPAEPAARHFVMMRDGAMAAGCLFDPALVCETFLRGVEGLLKAHAAPSYTEPADM